MTHGELICRNCFTETGIDSIGKEPNAEIDAQIEFVCPNCGSTSFAI
jgi:Zn finger protein HypA/HybF involved in hydrogenase expression